MIGREALPPASSVLTWPVLLLRRLEVLAALVVVVVAVVPLAAPRVPAVPAPHAAPRQRQPHQHVVVTCMVMYV